MDKLIQIQTPHAPAAIGPYSQAIVAGNMLFASGQIGLDPKQGVLCSDALEPQVKQALLNMDAILKAAGTDRCRVVKCSLFLTDMNDFTVVNKLYSEFFEGQEHFPARETIAVKALPAGALFEISCLAILAD
jgi:2-iminobutanoate/2-iminopropanoate deaminase